YERQTSAKRVGPGPAVRASGTRSCGASWPVECANNRELLGPFATGFARCEARKARGGRERFAGLRWRGTGAAALHEHGGNDAGSVSLGRWVGSGAGTTLSRVHIAGLRNLSPADAAKIPSTARRSGGRSQAGGLGFASAG